MFERGHERGRNMAAEMVHWTRCNVASVLGHVVAMFRPR